MTPDPAGRARTIGVPHAVPTLPPWRLPSRVDRVDALKRAPDDGLGCERCRGGFTRHKPWCDELESALTELRVRLVLKMLTLYQLDAPFPAEPAKERR